MPVLNLDRLSLHLAELCDITTIPWNNSPKTQRAVKETMAPYLPCRPPVFSPLSMGTIGFRRKEEVGFLVERST
ncbi:MAG: hypothetical protein ACOYCE_06590, partial [Limnochordia bacterium]|jgi:hypothetical protein